MSSMEKLIWENISTNFKMKNRKVIFLSLFALLSIVLSFILSWIFLIPAVAIVFINQKELFWKKKK